MSAVKLTLSGVLAASCLLFVAGCSENTPTNPSTLDSDAVLNTSSGYQLETTYEVTIENLTSGQPFSPPVAATHKRSVQMIPRRGMSTPELTSIAEDGDQSGMVSLLQGLSQVTDVVDVGAPIVTQGSTAGGFSDTITFQIRAKRGDRFSLASMLICSNDGFWGLSGVPLPPNGTVVRYALGYDAGTEDNTEMSTDIVDACSGIGPVALAGDPNGNENAAVDTSPQEPIRRHPGISGHGDLGSDHDFSGPVAKVTIRAMETQRRYRVTLTNLTSSQPLSPPVAATHNPSEIRMFRTGHQASAAIEAIAEDGDPSVMVNALSGNASVTDVVDVGQPLTRSGEVVGDFTDTVTFEINANSDDHLSLATMLICSNDGFTGVNALPLPNHGSRTVLLRALDAGTEENTELSADIVDACSALGPTSLAGDPNGNNNSGIETNSPIRRHRNIRGDGDLGSEHRWYGRVAKLVVERIE
ncbi:MAG: hypothetical protein HKN21_08510 [Candidatus Eisenbacteria bacterium]|uniref:Spondin domain-containing protein n=1 Tax=Eiseniibacteriota bacterium TaxID=2212470 RepID=A0A7Y2EBH2_UNCEI|nr:hypothetical protein [Candidatus Eisenbacteria bacterium]